MRRILVAFSHTPVSEDGGQDRHFTCVLLDRAVCNIISFDTFQSGCFLISYHCFSRCNI